MNSILLYDKRRLKPSKPQRKTETPISEQSSPEEQQKNMEILYRAQLDWQSLSEFRERATRCIRYSIDSDQWSDYIDDPDNYGRKITEKEFIRRQGKVPLVQNKIGAIVRNILGQYRSNSDKTIVVVRDPQKTQEEEVLTDLVQAISTANQAEELDAQSLNYFLHTGMEIQRVSFRYLKEFDRRDVFLENIDYNRVFFNSDIKDLRLTDLCRIGVIHDIGKGDFLSQFGKTEKDREFLESKWNAMTNIYSSSQGLNGLDEQSVNFLSVPDKGRIRVFECWYIDTVWRIHILNDPSTGTEGITSLTESQIEAINANRIATVRHFNESASEEDQIPEEEIPLIEYEKKIEQEWQYRFLLSDGTCLKQGTTPYTHQEHPFVMRLFPMVSGKVSGLVHQMIDQQRIINRMMTLWDFIISAGAKGVLMIPKNLLGDIPPEEFAKRWEEFNGVIVYEPDKQQPGLIPQQITANSVPMGVIDMLNMSLRLMEDISGVHAAIQGKTPNSGVSGKLYEQEAVNSALNTLDVIKTHAAFKQTRDKKMLKTALQFYNGKRRIISSGINGGILEFDADKIRDIDFDTAVIQNTNTPAYRSMVEDRLIGMVQNGILSAEMYFENSSDPTSKKIYESIKKMKEQQAGQVQAGQQGQAAQQGNPQAEAMLKQAINGQQQ